MKTALYIGRFQPLHKGHLDAIEQIKKYADKVVIMIGSKQYSNTKDNPFSYKEREEMLKLTTKEIEIVSLEDIHDNDRWVDYVKENLPPFDIVFTSNPLVHKLFNEKKIPVKELRFHINISGRLIREMIRNDKEKWENFVPDKIVNYMKKIDGIKRIKDAS